MSTCWVIRLAPVPVIVVVIVAAVVGVGGRDPPILPCCAKKRLVAQNPESEILAKLSISEFKL